MTLTLKEVFFHSYKAPAKGDGVDYVRTEDEVRENKKGFLLRLPRA